MHLTKLIKKSISSGFRSIAEPISYSPLPDRIVEEYNLTRLQENIGLLCNAPSRSLRFTYDGRAIVCCQNHSHTLGNYPDQTLKELWFGPKAEQLRELIRKNDLSSGCNSTGCESCAKMLTSSRYYHALARDFDYLPENSDGYPSLMEFELDTTCNLACIMCSPTFSSSIRKLQNITSNPPMRYDETFVTQLEEFIPYLHETRFYGGEPFVIPLHFYLWEKIIQIHPETLIFVQSNGTILTDRVKAIIERGRFLISLSIDSFVEETYNKIRVNSDFKTVRRNFSYFLDYSRRKDLQMAVVICPMRQNWREIPDIVKYLNDENIKLSFTTVLRPPECALWNLKSDELKEIDRHFKRLHYKPKNAQHKENLHYFDLLKEEVAIWTRDAQKRDKLLKKNSNPKLAAQLKKQFIDRICFQIDQQNHSQGNRSELLRSKLDEVFSHVDNEFTLISFLKKAQNYPVDEIIAAIESRRVEELVDHVSHKSRDDF